MGCVSRGVTGHRTRTIGKEMCVHKGRFRMVDHERKQQNYHIIHMLNNIENILEIYKYHIIRYENAESSEKLVALLGEKSKNMKPSSARN